MKKLTLFAALLLVTLTAQAVPPANDNFADAQTITETSTIAGINTDSATTEVGEPTLQVIYPEDPEVYDASLAHSVWYKIVAPTTGSYTVDTEGSETGSDTILGVLTGSALGSLTQVGASDDTAYTPTANYNSTVTWAGTEGTTYYIALGNLQTTKTVTINFYFPGSPSGNPVAVLITQLRAAADTTIPPTSDEIALRRILYQLTTVQGLPQGVAPNINERQLLKAIADKLEENSPPSPSPTPTATPPGEG
jgi:hypothetical protein